MPGPQDGNQDRSRNRDAQRRGGQGRDRQDDRQQEQQGGVDPHPQRREPRVTVQDLAEVQNGWPGNYPGMTATGTFLEKFKIKARDYGQMKTRISFGDPNPNNPALAAGVERAFREDRGDFRDGQRIADEIKSGSLVQPNKNAAAYKLREAKECMSDSQCAGGMTQQFFDPQF